MMDQAVASSASVSSSSILDKSDDELLEWPTCVSVNMNCPQDKVAALIGKRGVVVQEIMRRSGSRLFVDQNFPDGHPRQIQLNGTVRSVAVAMALISAVLEKGPSIVAPSTSPTDMDQSIGQTIQRELICPAARVGALIGSKGCNIYEILRRTGCKLQVVQDERSGEEDRLVTMTGTMEQISQARELAEQLIKNGSFDGTVLSRCYFVTVEYDVTPDKVGEVIGSKGVIIAEIMKRSGCKIFVNQNFPQGENHKVVFSGTQQQVDIGWFLVDVISRRGLHYYQTVLSGGDILSKSIELEHESPSEMENTVFIDEFQLEMFLSWNVLMLTSQQPNGPADGVFKFIGKAENVEIAIQLLYQRIGFKSMLADDQTPVTNHIIPLGRNGVSGHLDAPVMLPDFSYQQVAEIKNEVMGRIVGAKSANITLIKIKSGASLQVLKSDLTKGTTRVIISGEHQKVVLAGQLIQEVLVNGVAKLRGADLVAT